MAKCNAMARMLLSYELHQRSLPDCLTTDGDMRRHMQQRLLQAVRLTVPPLSYGKHKGQAGRIGVIGGSLE